jgi:hypothetical protein
MVKFRIVTSSSEAAVPNFVSYYNLYLIMHIISFIIILVYRFSTPSVNILWVVNNHLLLSSFAYFIVFFGLCVFMFKWVFTFLDKNLRT